MRRVIHVNQHNIRANIKNETQLPVITVKSYKKNVYGHEAVLHCPHCEKPAAKVVYPLKPLSCGARVWMETEAPVEVVDLDSGNKEIV